MIVPRLLSACLSLLPVWSAAQPEPAVAPAGNEQVKTIMETYAGRGTLADGSQPLEPRQALKTFTIRDGYRIELVASEPAVRQPLYMSFDSRGRLWVTQYIQYQFPAGLKVVSYDQHLRAVFDQVPPPPPRGPQGLDKVTVFEDRDGDGSFESSKDVITGLNIATAAVKGAGGIWVLNPPYLLFYPDANDDDIPDGDPQVCLRGFGLEDTHAVANSLTFGPDGWLYGAVGSTTTGNVSSAATEEVRFVGQHIWRYHPKSEVFELFAEGGGNTFSCEIDARGRVFSGTNAGARGMHYEQGMHGEKSFGKHGPAGNPYAFGYFGHMETESDGKRFSQAFCIYEGHLMPGLRGRVVAPNSLHNMVYVSRLVPDTSTFRAVDEAPLLTSSDRWFRPVDVKVGPDGALYMADWYDTRLSHVRPVDDWSKQDGRIYRVRPDGRAPDTRRFDLHRAPGNVLLDYLNHDNKWFRRQAALEIGWRRLADLTPQLEQLARGTSNPYAFDAVSALDMLGALRVDLARDLLLHPDPYVRRWVVRCAGDAGRSAGELAPHLATLAEREQHPEVKTQLLATARRLPARETLAIVEPMMVRDSDLSDDRIPLMLWWAVESKAETSRDLLLRLAAQPRVWESTLASRHVVQNLARRWATAGGIENFRACADLLGIAPDGVARSVVVRGVAQAFEGGDVPQLPEPLASALGAHLENLLDANLTLAVKTGSEAAMARALTIAADSREPSQKRLAVLKALTEARRPEAANVMLKLFAQPGEFALKRAVLPLAAQFDDPRLARAVISGYEPRFSAERELQDAAHRMLASRPAWAQLLLKQVDRWHIRAADVAPDVVRQMHGYSDPEIRQTVEKHWPDVVASQTAHEKHREMDRVRKLLRLPGSPRQGAALYTQRCAACHQLFGEGGRIGPDLTGYERKNVEFWLMGILDPNAEIREGYGAYSVKLRNGQNLLGMLAQREGSTVVLRDLSGETHALRSDQIDSQEALPQSLMPEGLLGGLTDQEIRDLFAYLMKP